MVGSMLPSTKAQDAPAAPVPPISLHCAGCGKHLKVRAALAGKKVKCPGCGQALLVPAAEPEVVEAVVVVAPAKRLSLLAVIVLVTSIFGCAVYANLSFAVTDHANYRYFPPFKAHVNNNH